MGTQLLALKLINQLHEKMSPLLVSRQECVITDCIYDVVTYAAKDSGNFLQKNEFIF